MAKLNKSIETVIDADDPPRTLPTYDNKDNDEDNTIFEYVEDKDLTNSYSVSGKTFKVVYEDLKSCRSFCRNCVQRHIAGGHENFPTGDKQFEMIQFGRWILSKNTTESRKLESEALKIIGN